MKLKVLLTLIVILPLGLYSQKNVGIGTLTPASDAVLELSSSDKGLLVPRLTTAERNAIGASSNGLLVYDTDLSRFFYWQSASGLWQVIDDFSKQNELLKMVSWNNVTKEMVLMDSGGTYTMDLSILSQMLSFTNDTLYLSDANEIYLGEYHKDSSNTNELIISTTFNTLTKEIIITDQGGTYREDLSILNQRLNFNSDTISISDGNEFYLGEYHKDSSSTNEIQGITRSSDSIFLDRGGVIQLPEDEYWNTDGNSGTTAAANYIGTNDNQPLVFRTNGIENMRLLPNGRLGIGTATPGGNLEVSSLATTGYATRIRNMAPNLAAGSQTVFMQGRNTATANQAEYRFNYVGNGSLLNAHAFGFSNIQPFVFFNANTRVGIGTNVPDQKLDVDGNIELSGGNREIHTEEAAPGASGASIKVRGSNHNNLGNFAVSGGDVILQGGSGYNFNQGRGGGHVILRSGYNDLTTNDGRRNGGYIIFQTGGAASAINERARMLDNGNFGLGTTNPIARLQVDGGRVEFTAATDASGTEGSGVLEIANSLRIDGNEMITNNGTELFLQSDNNGDLVVDNNTMRVDASTNRVGVRTATPAQALDVAGIVRLDPETNNGTEAMPVATVDAQGDINSNGYTPGVRSGSSLDWGGFSITPANRGVINLPNPTNNYVVITQILVYTWCNAICFPVEVNFKRYFNQGHSFAYSRNNGPYTGSTANSITVPINTSCSNYSLTITLNGVTNDLTCSVAGAGTSLGLYVTNGKTSVIRAF